MARKVTQRGGGNFNFPQLGLPEGGPEPYQIMKGTSDQPKLTDRGVPKIGMDFGSAPLGVKDLSTGKRFPGGVDPVEHAVAVQNFAHSLRTAPEHIVKSGMEWYPRANDLVSQAIRKKGFLSAHADRTLAGAGLFAALSPSSDWETANTRAVTEVSKLKSADWSQIHAATKPEQVAHLTAGKAISKSPLENLQRAGRIVAGEHPHDVIPAGSAPKTHSFMHNIADPSDTNFVTIDGRAFDTLTNVMRPWNYSGRGIGGSTGAKSMPGRYTNSVNAITAAADQLGLPNLGAQAVSWEHTKLLERTSGGRTEGKQGPARVGQRYFSESGEPDLQDTQGYGRRRDAFRKGQIEKLGLG